MPVIVPVEWLGTDETQQCGSVRGIVPVAAVDSAGVVGWRIPALKKDHYCISKCPLVVHGRRYRLSG